MTLAICMFCGTEKFGAFVPCNKCGQVPTTILDRAKSLMLSAHNFPPDELGKFSRTIESGMDVPYDPVTLAICAEPIAEEEYYWRNITDTGRLHCMRCQNEFAPEDEQVFCSRCRSEIEREFRVCVSCLIIYDDEARFCQKCGTALSTRGAIKCKEIARDVAFSVRRLYQMQSAINKSNFLGPIHRELSPENRATAEAELERIAFYSAILALRQLSPSEATVLAVVTQALEIYRQSFLLQGATPVVAEELIKRFVKRFSEYDAAFASAKTDLPNSSERWLLFVAGNAVENCYRLEKRDLGTTMDMVLFIGYFVKMLTDTTKSLLRSHLGIAKSGN